MSATIKYFYGLISPWSFLGHERLRNIAGTYGATIEYYPISLPGVFSKTGGVPLKDRARERQDYRLAELKRWSEWMSTPINIHPRHFPVDDVPATLAAIAAAEMGDNIADISLRIMRAVWQEERNVADLDTLKEIADEAGLDGAALAEKMGDLATAATVEANKDAALAEGCFGAPWYVVDGEPFWGQDRLEFVEHRLRSAPTQ